MKLGVQQRKRGMSTEDADVKAKELKDTLFCDDDGKRSSRLMPMRAKSAERAERGARTHVGFGIVST